MILALALLVGVVAVAGSGPAFLDRMIRHKTDPQAVLVTWIVLVVATFLTMIATLTVVLLPTSGPTPLLVQLVHHCWLAVRHGAVPRFHEIAALALIGALLLTAVQTGVGLLRYGRHQRKLHHKHLQLLRGIANCEQGPFITMWLPHSKPLAYSVAGSPSFVVATEGVRNELAEIDAAAVLEHERAHLRGRHHLLVGLAEALAKSVPWIPLTRRSPELVRTAVELAADRAAARKHGPGAVQSALRMMSAMGGPDTPQHALGMTDSCVALRLDHLGELPEGATVAKRLLLSGTAGLMAASAPAMAGIGSLTVIGILTCPL
ncbi:M56 family metallopeptidase [Saccharopolyspora sp. ID03-671]|uniref:M56 family metallopeptidase n=1 Tax=Saccharopolyspora sp. ID03-671 TaxID=3073066 RepID=UPI003253C9A6